VRGMSRAIEACAQRAAQLARRLGDADGICLVGGVPHLQTAVSRLSAHFPAPPHLPPDDLRQFIAALGAARLGLRFGGSAPMPAPTG